MITAISDKTYQVIYEITKTMEHFAEYSQDFTFDILDRERLMEKD